jgi:NAD(P)H-dependent FMN reductase
MKHVLILNGSPHGAKGNCQKLISKIRGCISRKVTSVEVVTLLDIKTFKGLLKKIEEADGVIFVTGTYWDSWGSPLQRLLENCSDLEGSEKLMGKPCACFVLKHSVGGKGVLSRLQGVLSTMGFLIPPMSGMVYSLVSDLALKGKSSRHKDDFWELGDVKRVIENFELSLNIEVPWKAWPVDRVNYRKTWLK